jgi:ribose/xylose/arabinose/galactoside ABC-type transport system permease subunit
MPSFGRILISIGLIITAAGLVVLFLNRFNVPMGHLPGDITFTGKNVTFYFPIVTCIVVSIVLSVVFWLLNRR